MRVQLDEQEKSTLEEEDMREDKELQMYIVERLTQAIIDRPHATSFDSPTDDLKIKSPSSAF